MFHEDYHLQDISHVEDRSLEFIGSPGVLLTFSGEGQLIFIGRQNIFELNFFTKKKPFLIKPGGQNLLNWSIFPAPVR